MGFLYKSNLKFDLHDSDNKIGGLFHKKDVQEILNISSEDFRSFYNELFIKSDYVDENDLQLCYYKNRTNRNITFDELLLSRLIKTVYPDAIIEHQIRIGKYVVDLKVTVNNISVFIEFEGIHHFKSIKYGKPKSVLIKKEFVEQTTGLKLFNWAFWISRCETNVKRLFDNSITGRGSIFSSKYLFNDFDIDEADNIIKNINNQFGIENCSKLYDHYNFNRLLKRCDKKDETLYMKQFFIPKGIDLNGDIDYWLPESYF